MMSILSNETPERLADQYLAERLEVEDLEAKLKRAKQRMRDVEAKLALELKEAKKTLKHGELTFIATRRTCISATQQAMPSIVQWLEEQGGDLRKLTRPELHPKHFKDWLLDYVDDNPEAELPAGLNLFEPLSISVRGFHGT